MASTPETKNPRTAIRKVKSPAALLKDVIREMKHVTWPTRKDATRMTGVVIALCLMITVFLFVVGLGMEFVGNLLWGAA
jgi:preprotein translocase subunit SecE